VTAVPSMPPRMRILVACLRRLPRPLLSIYKRRGFERKSALLSDKADRPARPDDAAVPLKKQRVVKPLYYKPSRLSRSPSPTAIWVDVGGIIWGMSTLARIQPAS